MIDTTKLTLSLSTVNISAQILNTKDVPLEFEAKGEPADGYVLTGVESSLDTVRIKGEAATLNTVSKITIPQEVLDISGITEDLTTTVDISSYLPGGTALVLNSDAKVEVTAKVEPVVEATYEVPVANFTIQNVRDGYNANYMESTVAVEISGAESELAGISAKDITGTADASNLGAGEHHLNVEITLEQEHCWVTGTVTLPVTITDHNTAETGTSDNTGYDRQCRARRTIQPAPPLQAMRLTSRIKPIKPIKRIRQPLRTVQLEVMRREAATIRKKVKTWRK